MLATLHRAPFSLEGGIFEWKYDGFRCLVRKQGDQVELISRLGNALNRSISEIILPSRRCRVTSHGMPS
jgi:ATP-dependent DNA ligase